MILLYLFVIPLLVLLAAQRWPVIQKISPMVILYVIGLLVGNIGHLGESSVQMCSTVSNIVVLIAIPLMLLGCDFRMWSAKAMLKTFATGLCSILFVTVAGFFLFRGMASASDISSSDFAKVAAVMTGIYTGGIPNLAPIAKSVDLPDNLFLLVSGYDLVVTALYLVIVVFFGKGLVRLFFPSNRKQPNTEPVEDAIPSDDAVSTGKKSFWHIAGNRLLGILVSIAIVAISYGISKIIPLENSVAVIVITITTISILLSFWKPVRRLEGTFDVGLYFVYVFCLAVATMVNIHDLEFSRYLFILYYVAFAVFGSLLIQILLSRIFKVDGNLVLASSIALINSPPFVPMVAAVLKDRNVILPGIAVGLLGYAVGNYLGIGMFLLLN